MESFVPRLEVLESRLLFLEKRDKEKNCEILDLKEQNLVLNQNLSQLKGQEGSLPMSGMESDLGVRMDKLEDELTKVTATLGAEFGKVTSIQKVFNRMLVNGHQNDLEKKLTELQTKCEEMSTEMENFIQMDMENKISELDTRFTKTKTEVSKIQRQGLEKKMASLQTQLDELSTDMGDFKQTYVEKKISELESKLTKMKTEVSRIQRQGLEKKIISLVRARLSDCTDMQVLVVVDQSTGEKVSLDVEPSRTVSQLKSLLQQKMGVDLCYQVFEFGGIELTDSDSTLEDLGIDDGSVLNLTVRSMQLSVVVQSTGDHVTVEVEPSHTVAHLKSLINDKTGVSPSYQVLEFGGTNLADDDKTMEGFGIGDSALIMLIVKQSNWEILVKTNEGEEIKLDVGIRTSVRETIYRIYHKMKVLLIRHKAILFNGQELEQTKLLVEYGIRHDSTLDLVLLSGIKNEPGMKILIDDQVVDVHPSTSVFHLKCALHPRSPSDFQTLTFKENTLSNDKKLSDCGITPFSSIYSSRSSETPRQTVQVIVKMCRDNKWTHKATMDFWNTLEDLKRLIQDEKSVPAQGHTLLVHKLSTTWKNENNDVPKSDKITVFNPCISFSDATNLSDVLLDPRITQVVQREYNAMVRGNWTPHKTEINQTFSLPYNTDSSQTSYAKCATPCPGKDSYYNSNRSYQHQCCKQTIHVKCIEFVMF